MDNQLYTIPQFIKCYPAFTNGFMRAAVFNRQTNGFDKVIKQVSPTGKRGRIFIDVDAFFKWIETSNNSNIINAEQGFTRTHISGRDLKRFGGTL